MTGGGLAAASTVADLAAGAGWAAALGAVLAAGRMWAALARRAALVAQAAHELRGPLFAAGLALHGAATDPRRLAAAELELRRAGLALEDLTCAPRGRRAPAAAEPLDGVLVAAEVIAGWRPVARRFGADLRVDVPARPVGVHADRLRMAQALANLVINAAEHGRGDVVVRVRVGETGVRFVVRDEGPGPGAERVAEAMRAAGGRRASAGRRGHGLSGAAAGAARPGGRLAAVPTGGVALELPLGSAGFSRPQRVVRAAVASVPRRSSRQRAAAPAAADGSNVARLSSSSRADRSAATGSTGTPGSSSSRADALLATSRPTGPRSGPWRR